MDISPIESIERLPTPLVNLLGRISNATLYNETAEGSCGRLLTAFVSLLAESAVIIN
jgi:hypothetical protein